LRIPGVGSEYADLLEVAGVDTIRELRRRNPDRLLETMTELNLRKRLVRRLPTDPMVREWVEGAKQLEPLVTH
jgi:nucleotidyltransferase/DNA polymerase involved in DNA repair